MPIYEEKIISPLSVRFIQEHIRSTFRDGRALSESLAQIEEDPGEGEYDVVLRAPFPNIEVIRWEPSVRRMGAECCEDVEFGLDTGSHWFTFDNRRLYCLQRAAAALWPKKVAAVVEIMYADPGTLKRKYDSETLGRSVSIETSVHMGVPIERWDWREFIARREAGLNSCSEQAANAQSLLELDDAKESVGQLQDRKSMCSAAMRFLAAEEAQNLNTDISTQRSTSCDVDVQAVPAEDSDEADDERSADESSNSDWTQRHIDILAGVWKSKGETYTISFNEGMPSGTCLRQGNGPTRRFTILLDQERDIAWWGLEEKFGVDLAQLRSRSTDAMWYAGHTFNGTSSPRRAKWTWSKTQAADDYGTEATTSSPKSYKNRDYDWNRSKGYAWNQNWEEWQWSKTSWGQGGGKNSNQARWNGKNRWVPTVQAAGGA